MATRRRKIRELALQVLFVWDSSAQPDPASAQAVVNEAPETDVRAEALQMATGAWEMRQIADQWMIRLAPQWPPHRQPAVDRSLLRLAIHELTSASTPPKVVIDEAIELAKEYSTEQSAAFVNGVLDAVLKEKQELLKPGT